MGSIRERRHLAMLTVFWLASLLGAAPVYARSSCFHFKLLPWCREHSGVALCSGESDLHIQPGPIKQESAPFGSPPVAPAAPSPRELRKSAMSAEFFKAIDAGDVQKVSQLLKAGVTVDVTNERGMPPLVFLFYVVPYQGTSKAQLEIARLLLSHGADPNGFVPLSVNSSRVPVLDWAIHSQSPEIIRLLLEYGADPTIHGCEPLFVAVGSDQAKIADILINHGADVNARDEYGETPLFVANSIAVARVLVGHGADVNAVDNDGKSVVEYLSDPYKYCGKCGCIPVNEKIVNYLKSKGAK